MASFQSIIIQLQEYWAAHDCLIAQPYYTQVGAGTMNPATFLRVLGPEPWNVAYVEPSVRPDDGRYGENPNRFQVHYQYQVILKPDPGNPQELYLDSLKALGINPREHDIRFVEDNWEQPAISAWGLGWEVWLDGQEITQFTYFQQVGGVTLDPVAVELTYGLERILIAINNARAIWEELWGPGVTYGEIRRREEFEHSKYYFEVADVKRIRQAYDLYRSEAEACLKAGLVLPAHDYVLKCSHAFNTLDTRGAVGVTERQIFFGQMRELARRVAEAYLEQRKAVEYPLLREQRMTEPAQRSLPEARSEEADFVLEIGTEELPAGEVTAAQDQLTTIFEKDLLQANQLVYKQCRVFATPRRLVVVVEALKPNGPAMITELKGPPETVAFKDGKPTQALLGWMRKNELVLTESQLNPEYLVRERDGGRYVVQTKEISGSSVADLFPRMIPVLIKNLKFEKVMRWNASGVSFSRPIRWLMALYGDTVLPFEFAGVNSGNITRGLRPLGSPELVVTSAEKYLEVIREAGILIDIQDRKKSILDQVKRTADFVGGEAVLSDELLQEVGNLVENPTAVLGNFNPDYLDLPREVLVSVMVKNQRYFPVEKNGRLLPNFIAIRNGDDQHLDLVQQGNEHVLGARFADAEFFVRADLKHKLEEFRPKLERLMFQKDLGSMLDKSERMLKFVREIASMLRMKDKEVSDARRATYLAKADLATQMVTEMTSLQGVLGREYAIRSGENQVVADAIGEQYLPLPRTKVGVVLALTDRLDTLVGLFAAGISPTGARDPFGMRRAALGVLQPLLEHQYDIDLRIAIKKAAGSQPIKVSLEVQQKVLEFIGGRLEVLLKDDGFKHDIVDAVLSEQVHNPNGARKAVRQFQIWVERPDWHEILPGFARCVRIVRDQKKTFDVTKSLLVEKEEKELLKVLENVEKTRRVPGSVDDLLNAFLPMLPKVNAFFDKVLVMAKRKDLRQNRLGLLQRIAGLAEGVADLSKLEGF
jgi:glycyl-tRNA synthetase